MPTYEYACQDCGEHLKVVQSFADEPLKVCGKCQGRLRKVFSAAGIIFKGSGYYVTDSRKKPAEAGSSSKDSGKGSSSKESDSKDSGSKESGSKDSGSEPAAKTESTPKSDAPKPAPKAESA